MKKKIGRLRTVMMILVSCLILTVMQGCHIHIDLTGQAKEANGASSALTDVNTEQAKQAEENRHIETDDEILKKVEEARLANPWGETQSLTVATEWAGLDFAMKEEEIVLENGQKMELATYRYRTGTVEALYKSEGYELRVGKARDVSDSMPGDKERYASEWEESYEGFFAHCFGDGENIRMAYIDEGEDHYYIMFDSEEEECGLTSGDLSLLAYELGK
ncbi:MAG: hypothetical protein K5770_09070 [Lachnospiraceae bacterium]|nr:hypothetical protein [Lachnospiraceae bacterium]